ncbi:MULTISPECIES: uroporphyrinogen-III C-methyltransferase [Halomonadaceae]|uniref:uroporphyrinogen-III C-methyltransferase n=1 Tax=Halomonadaceae TaxID=28256 RepID=UPI0014449E09|nr:MULTISPECIES: uroporphyrinogen-III C-methyltransferase [Halomonas]MCG7576311.1 uroporphyrinogen-III C-methyltransferase [Halomonas sp. MMH1-48]MCG7603374.1 uroporphyrinogen-III C-methyltransferase [Halomonas sp. MM17-34]MCG7612624.1 uroporphyrinogen-III C-methyltransferase [Halomonas sp. MM17-29]MCG7619810.1 uroporphyrinogen-III C-methyltransferase [Halomonas sp. DSH1-27]
MSKQPNEQEGVNNTSADTSQANTPSSDTAASSSKSESTASSASSSYAAKNSRSRRRHKSANSASSAPQTGTASNNGPTSDSAKTSAASNTKDTKDTKDAKNSAADTKPAASSGSAGKPIPPASTAGSGGSKGGGLAIALVIILALALGLITWQGWQRLDSQQQRLDELAQQAQNSASQQAVSELESRIEEGEAERSQALESTVSELRSELDSYRSDVNSTLDEVLTQLSQEQDTDERDWLHAEAAYLLRLANQRLQLEGDVEGAAALLRTADARLADADNPALTPVRREIANELAALDAVPQVDRTGIYLALNAQQERVAGLRLSQEIEERAVTSSIEQPPTGTFQRQLARFGEELKDLVVIRQHDEALEALITPEQESYLRQSLRLILEQSQLALLKEEPELYEASIDKALELLNGYYDTEREETQSVIARLQELKQAEVKPELPDISASQQALASFIDNRFESRRQDGGDA